MLYRKLLLLGLCTQLWFFSDAQTGCPDCIITLPDTLAEDTIYLSDAPDGRARVYYEADLSFRLPKSTTPVSEVDPDVPPGLPINKITIEGVTNLPPGLSWEPSQFEFDTDEQTDGCVRFCGVPLQPGLYMVNVLLTARVVVVNESTSITIPLLILPAESTTEGFRMVNAAACGSAEVSFENLAPSGGQAGFSYFWDFGNGNTSTEEVPDTQLYDIPGLYPISYQAVIDTTGYFLTRVDVNAVGCDDLLGGRPDLKINVIDPGGNLIYVSDIVNNATPPVSFELNLELFEGTYLLAVTDDDSGLGGADDQCGTVPFSQENGGAFTSGMLELNIEILHPVDTINSTDTVRVFDQPDPPQIVAQIDMPLCEGDSALLFVMEYDSSLQWYRDSVPLIVADEDSLIIYQSGQYWVDYTSPDGCISTSVAEEVQFGDLPSNILFVAENNELSIFDTSILPAEFGIRWFQDSLRIKDEDGLSYCIDTTAVYTLEVTDLATGCFTTYSQLVNYDPNFPNCMTSAYDLTPLGVMDIGLSPNPTSGPLRIDMLTDRSLEMVVRLYSSAGQLLRSESWRLGVGQQRRDWDIRELPSGVYLVQFMLEGRSQSHRILRQ